MEWKVLVNAAKAGDEMILNVQMARSAALRR
jgi:hypothetical protein